MSESDLIIIVVAALAAFLIAMAALMRGWSGWLELKRAQLAPDSGARSAQSPAQRIELADLKERVRRLEAIANGVEG